MNFDFSTLTWQQIVLIFQNPALYINFAIVMAGMALSGIQKSKLEGQAGGSFWQWFLSNRRATFFSFLGAIGGFLWLYNDNSTDVIEYFGAGYMSDAFFNRAKGLLGIPNVKRANSEGKPSWQKFLGW